MGCGCRGAKYAGGQGQGFPNLLANNFPSGTLTRMKLHTLLACLFLTTSLAVAADVPRIAPAEAAKLVAEGKAVLVDVREPREWKSSGVAAPAVLLAKSDFDGEQKEWKGFLAKVGDKQVLLYCASGGRSGTIATKLAAQGIKTANVGGFKDWANAGLPVRKVEEEK